MHYRDATGDRHGNRTTERSASTDESVTTATGRTAGITAIIVGSSASIEKSDATAEVGTQDSETDDEPEPGHLLLIPMSEYRPGLTVRVIDRLPAPITVRLLRLPNGETVPVLERPDEYTGYVVRVEPGAELVYSTMIVFTRESLDTDTRYTLEADSQVFSTQLNLFRVTARPTESDESERGPEARDNANGNESGTGTENESESGN